MSINKFCSYLKSFGISKSSILNIIKTGSLIFDPLSVYSRISFKDDKYYNRYHGTNRSNKLYSLTHEQESFIINLRSNEPNMGYKRFENKLIIPEILNDYIKIFGTDKIISKRLFYSVLKKHNMKHRIKKSTKVSLIRKYRKNNKLDFYIGKMKGIYSSIKALHRWQVDIKYLTDIPNYLELGLFNIYHYQITFRDYKSGLVLLFYGNNRDKSRIFVAMKIFRNLLELIGVDPKNIILQFDGGAEFSNIRISGSKGRLIEFVEKEFRTYKIIDRKEQNGHVEAFHRTIEEELFDTKYINNLKKIIKSSNDKGHILKLIASYIQNYNKYWYSSYLPRYNSFGKKSPIQIVKMDWGYKIRYDLIEKYFTAYDVDGSFRTKRIHEFTSLLNAVIYYNENLHSCKFALPTKNIINDSVNNLGGQIGVGGYINYLLMFTFSLNNI